MEVLVAVVVLGILIAAAYATATTQRQDAVTLVLRERALQALEVEAEAIVRRVAVDPGERDQRLSTIPDARFSSRDVGDTTVLALDWKRPGSGRGQLELVVLRRLP